MRTKFKNFKMLGFYKRLERGKIYGACSWRAVITSGELDIVDMKPRQSFA